MNNNSYYEACSLSCQQISQSLKEIIKGGIHVWVDNYDGSLRVDIYREEDIGKWHFKLDNFVDEYIYRGMPKDLLIHGIVSAYRNYITSFFFKDLTGYSTR